MESDNQSDRPHRRRKFRHQHSRRHRSISDSNTTGTPGIYPSLGCVPSESSFNSSIESEAHDDSYEHRHQRHLQRRRRRGLIRGFIRNGMQNLNNRLHDQISMYYQNHNNNPTASINRPMMDRSFEYHRGRAGSDTISGLPVESEMHEFIRGSPSEHEGPSPQMYNPYAPPPTSLVSSSIDSAFQLFQHPMNAINQVSNILGVRLPGDLLHEATSHIPRTIPSLIKPPGNAQPVYNYNQINVQHDRPEPRREDSEVIHPPPPLPPIDPSIPQTRLESLTLLDVAKDQELWNIDALCVRVFKGGIENNNDTRLKLWPYLLGMAEDDDYIKIGEVGDEIQVNFDWTELEKRFDHYQKQWQSILPEQEKRFSIYREVKSLIQRDVIRCDRTHPFYQGEDNENLEKLRILLLTYVMHDFDTGYVQGMSDLASPLLYVTGGDVCKAFWFFVKVMEFTKCNFEMLQTAIKLQHSLLWKLINITDPVFGQYLKESDAMHCYFAFRWFVCQFKREVMKKNDDGYHDVLLLWESIWTCSAMRRRLQDQRHHSFSSGSVTPNEHGSYPATDSSEDPESPRTIPVFHTKHYDSVRQEFVHKGEVSLGEVVENMANVNLNDEQFLEEEKKEKKTDKVEKARSTSEPTMLGASSNLVPTYHSMLTPRLTDTQLYVLCTCLAIIRRERDLILTNQYSNADILKHFNTLEVNSDLKNILIHASNIWSWLVLDGNEELLYKEDSISTVNNSGDNGNGQQAGNLSRNDEDYDLLSDITSTSPVNLNTIHSISNSDDFIFSSS